VKTHIETPPRTLMEVYKMLPGGTLAELIDNVLYMSPSPVFSHQSVIKSLARRLFTHVEDGHKGLVFFAPYDVYLDEEKNAVQPDLIVVLQQNRHIIDPNGHIHGVPDMLMEILSPGNKKHDLERKKDLYEHFGVREYWIIDPDTKLAIGYALDNAQYKCIAEDTGLIKSPLLQASFTF
jgi:Uma2 family endonuclease